MERAEYRGQASLHFVEAMPIAAGRAGWGALNIIYSDYSNYSIYSDYNCYSPSKP